jgi:HTH-type transcriptional regulator/antitoxin HigA
MIDKIEAEAEAEADYDAALKQIKELWNAELDTLKGKELDELVTLVEEYEAIHYPISPPSKEASIRFRIDQQTMPSKDDDSQ